MEAWEDPQWRKEGQKNGETDDVEFTTEKLPMAVAELQDLIQKYSSKDLEGASEILRSKMFPLATAKPAAIAW